MNSNKYFSIALIVSILIWLVLGYFVYIGMQLSGINITEAIVIWALFSMVGFGLSFLSSAIKTRRNAYKQSRWSEVLCLGLTLGVLVFGLFYAPSGMNYLISRTELIQARNWDLNSTQSMINQYRDKENARLDVMVQGLNNFYSLHMPVDGHPQLFHMAQGNFLTRATIDNYRDDMRENIEHCSVNGSPVLERYIQRLDSIKRIPISLLKAYGCHDLGPRLKATSDSLAIMLTSQSRRFDFYEINSSGGFFVITESASNSYSANEHMFGSYFSELFNPFPMALIYIVLCFFAVWDYILCYRGSVRPSRRVKLSTNNCTQL